MIETTIEILTRYPFQVVLWAVVLFHVVRVARVAVTDGHKGRHVQRPTETSTAH